MGVRSIPSMYLLRPDKTLGQPPVTLLWMPVIVEIGKRDQRIAADDKGKNDTFIALWIHDSLPQGWYPMHSYER